MYHTTFYKKLISKGMNSFVHGSVLSLAGLQMRQDNTHAMLVCSYVQKNIYALPEGNSGSVGSTAAHILDDWAHAGKLNEIR
jgi:hypothetical protein